MKMKVKPRGKPKQLNVTVRKSVEGLVTANYVALRRLERLVEQNEKMDWKRFTMPKQPSDNIQYITMAPQIVRVPAETYTPAFIERIFSYIRGK